MGSSITTILSASDGSRSSESKEERERQRVTIAGTQGVAERRAGSRQCGRGVVYHNVIIGRRTTTAVDRSNSADAEPRIESLQVDVDGRLVGRKDSLAILVERIPGIVAQRICCGFSLLFGQMGRAEIRRRLCMASSH